MRKEPSVSEICRGMAKVTREAQKWKDDYEWSVKHGEPKGDEKVNIKAIERGIDKAIKAADEHMRSMR